MSPKKKRKSGKRRRSATARDENQVELLPDLVEAAEPSEDEDTRAAIDDAPAAEEPAQLGVACTRIGTVVAGPEITLDGRPVSAAGYQHFR